MARSVIFWLLISTAPLLRAVEQDGKAPEIPAALVARTIAWQIHWDQRMGIASKAPESLTFRVNQNSEVWVDGLLWTISFDDRNGELFPFHVEHAPDKAKRNDFASLPKARVTLPVYTNGFHKISTINADVRGKLLAAFTHEVGTNKDVKFYEGQIGHPVENIRVWIAPVDLHFPVLLYVVDGVPYIGKVYFGTRSLKPLYSEFNYITDPGSEAHEQGLKLINAIKAEGTSFALKDGQMVPLGP